MVLTWMLGCTAGDLDTAESLEALAFRGDQGVGYSTEVLTTTDPMGAERVLSLAHWYPTTDTSGSDAEYLGWKREDVWEDATMSSPDAPVVVFSHGHRGYPQGSGFLMVHLASWGFHVVALEHAGDTTFDDADRDTDIYYQRPADVSATLDHLGVDEALAGGHSFGGYTLYALAGASYDPAVYACDEPRHGFCDTMTDETRALFAAGFRDERIRAIVPMASGDADLFGEGLADVEVPVMMMSGDCDHLPGSVADDLWTGFSGEGDIGVVIADGGHQTFTNFAGLLDDCDPLIDPEEGWTIIQGWTLAYARYHLLGDEQMSTVLAGETRWSEARSLR